MTNPLPQQHPIGSGFGPETTAREVIGSARFDGCVAIVTGGYAGIGLETTRTLRAAGATVVVPARTPDKAQRALAGLEGVELEQLDLADPASIDAFVRRFLESGRALTLLINNAGIMATPLSRDARGFESQLATNHFGHFQLTLRLWPALRKAHGARVVTLTSRGHARSAVDFDDPHFERRPYEKWVAYGQSKTANALFAIGADARGTRDQIHAFSVHPGAIVTDLMRHMDAQEAQAAIDRIQSISRLKTPEQGAATSVWCAASSRLSNLGGVYCEDVDIARPVPADDATGPSGVRPWACDPEAAERLWQLSERSLGLSLPD